MGTYNISEEDLRAQVNDQEFFDHRIGGLVFIAILMPIGIIGNLLVLIVYGCKMRASNHRVFIVALGVLDLSMCAIGMPFVIVERRLPLLFDMFMACKVLLLHNFVAALSSTFLLLVIALERYRKVCQPLKKQITVGQAKKLSLFVVVLALSFAWPSVILYGLNTDEWPNPINKSSNITGYACYVGDHWKDTEAYVVYQLLMLALMFCISSLLVFLYISVARAISSSASKFSPPRRPSENSSTATERTSKSRETSIPRKESRVGSVSSMRRRTTMIFILITLFFFLSYAPYLVIELITNVDSGFLRRLPSSGQFFFNTFKETYFINHVVNCILYGICDYRFREKVRNLLVNIFYCGKK